MKLLNSGLLLVGLFTLLSIESHEQPPPPPNIVISGQPDVNGNPTIIISGKPVSIVPAPTPVPAPVQSPITTLPCTGPGLTPPSYRILVTTALGTTNCLAYNGVLLQVAPFTDSGFVANAVISASEYAFYAPTSTAPTVLALQLLSGGPYVVTSINENSAIVCSVGLAQCMNWTITP